MGVLANDQGDPYWSGDFIKKLAAAGVVPKDTHKIVIVAEQDKFVTVDVECHPKTGPIVDALEGQTVRET